MLKAKIFQGPCTDVEADLNAWMAGEECGELEGVHLAGVHGMSNHVTLLCFYECLRPGVEWNPPAEVNKTEGGEAPHEHAEPQSIRHDETGAAPQTPPAS